jgi:hypothetical protein
MVCVVPQSYVPSSPDLIQICARHVMSITMGKGYPEPVQSLSTSRPVGYPNRIQTLSKLQPSKTGHDTNRVRFWIAVGYDLDRIYLTWLELG